VYQIAVVLCTTRNSPLATSVTGNAKDILATCAAWLVIGNKHREHILENTF